MQSLFLSNSSLFGHCLTFIWSHIRNFAALCASSYPGRSEQKNVSDAWTTTTVKMRLGWADVPDWFETTLKLTAGLHHSPAALSAVFPLSLRDRPAHSQICLIEYEQKFKWDRCCDVAQKQWRSGSWRRASLYDSSVGCCQSPCSCFLSCILITYPAAHLIVSKLPVTLFTVTLLCSAPDQSSSIF